MSPKRIWEEDVLARRIVTLSERLLRLRALVPTLSRAERESVEGALLELEESLHAVQPDDPEGKLLAELRSELERRKIAASQVARELEISRQSLNGIFTGRSHLGPKMFERLSRWVSESQKHPDAID